MNNDDEHHNASSSALRLYEDVHRQHSARSGKELIFHDRSVRPLKPGMTYGELQKVTLEELRDDTLFTLLSTGRDDDRELAERALVAADAPQLTAIINSRKTFGFNEHVNMLSSGPAALATAAPGDAGDAQAMDTTESAGGGAQPFDAEAAARAEAFAKVQEKLNTTAEHTMSKEHREYAQAQYQRLLEKVGVRDEATGELRFPSKFTRENAVALGAAFDANVFVRKPYDVQEVVRLANYAPEAPKLKSLTANVEGATDGGDAHMGTANGDASAQHQPPPPSMAEAYTEESAKEMHEKIENRLGAVLNARRLLNPEVTTSAAENPTLGVAPEAQLWLHGDAWQKYWPLGASLVERMMNARAAKMRLSLTVHPAYSMCVFPSRLIRLITGYKMPHAVSFYAMYQLYDAIFTHVVQTDVRPNHETFLKQQLQRAYEMQKVARDNNDQVALGFTAVYAQGIAEAMKAWSETKTLVSPYQKLLNLPPDSTIGARWKHHMIMEHSKDEVAHILTVQKYAALKRYEERLLALEATMHEIRTKKFLEEFYLLQHVLCVDLLKCYELGLMMLYEEVILPARRGDLCTLPDMVEDKHVDEFVVDTVRKERISFAAMREFVHRKTVEEHKDTVRFKRTGVKLTISKAPNVPVDERLRALSPTYLELAQFYIQSSIEYEDEEQFTIYLQEMENVYRSLSGKSIEELENLNETLHREELREISGTREKKKRMDDDDDR